MALKISMQFSFTKFSFTTREEPDNQPPVFTNPRFLSQKTTSLPQLHCYLQNLSHYKGMESDVEEENKLLNSTRLLVSGRSPECSDCLLRFMEQQ